MGITNFDLEKTSPEEHPKSETLPNCLVHLTKAMNRCVNFTLIMGKVYKIATSSLNSVLEKNLVLTTKMHFPGILAQDGF